MLKVIDGMKRNKKSNSYFAYRYKLIEEKTLDELLTIVCDGNEEMIKWSLGKLYLSRVRKCYYRYYSLVKDGKGIPLDKVYDMYFDSCEAIESIKTLSLDEMLCLFPISKIYKMDQFTGLNYYTTIEAIKRIKPREPFRSENEKLSKEEFNEKNNEFNRFIINYLNEDISQLNITHYMLNKMNNKIEHCSDESYDLVRCYPILGKFKVTLHMDNRGKKYFRDNITRRMLIKKGNIR